MDTAADATSDAASTTVLKNVPPLLEEYKFTRKVIGKCLIINNHNFDPIRTGQIERAGSDVDACAIERTFSVLGFEVYMKKDLTCMQMRFAVSDMAEENHTDYDCFVCFILSHGCENEIIYGVDGQLKLYDLIEKVKGSNCPSLIGKPKLFFVQACRGSYFDYGVELVDGSLGVQGLDAVKTISSEADVMIAYSVVPGHFSWRNNVDGSWFIQSLCHVLSSKLVQTTDLLGIMTVVCKLVSEKFESVTDDRSTSGFKQVPWIVSTLTKLVYLKKNLRN